MKKGRIVSVEGEVLGEHDGIHKFTIGQRRGLGISSLKRQYVLGFNLETNDVILGDEKGLLSEGLIANNCNLISVKELSGEYQCAVKIRYSGNEWECIISPCDDGKIRVEFDLPQRAVTPGQAVVFYNGDEVIGGGWIERAIH